MKDKQTKTFTEDDLVVGKIFSMKFGGTCKITRVADGLIDHLHTTENVQPSMESLAPSHTESCTSTTTWFLSNIIDEIKPTSER